MSVRREPWKPPTASFLFRYGPAASYSPSPTPTATPVHQQHHQQEPSSQQPPQHQLQHQQEPQHQPQAQHQHQHQHQPAPVQEAGKSTIPQLTTIAPAIFREIEGDELTVPFTPPASRLRRIESKLENLRQHNKKVRENSHALHRQECLRHIQNTHNWEKENPERVFEGHDPASTNPTTRQGLDLLVENMYVGFEAEDEDATDRPKRSVEELQKQTKMQMETQTAPRVAQHALSRQALVRVLEQTIVKGLVDLDSFDDHVGRIKKQYKEIHEREVARDKELDFD